MSCFVSGDHCAYEGGWSIVGKVASLQTEVETSNEGQDENTKSVSSFFFDDGLCPCRATEKQELMEEIEAKLKETEADFNKARQDLSKTHSELGTLKGEISAANFLLQERGDQVWRLENAIGTMREDNSKLHKRLDETLAEQTRDATVVLAARRQLAELKARSGDTSTTALSPELDTEEEDTKAAGDLREKDKKDAEQMAEWQRAQIQLSMYKAEIEGLIEDRTRMQRQAVALNADKETLQEKLDALKEELGGKA